MWWKEAKFYEVYVDKFAKDFNGLAEKLPYLKNLGINCVWLLPHYPSPMIDDGYDVSDYMNIRADLGTLDDFANFTTKAHEAGIRVMLDFVLNHVSSEHPWFVEASSSKDNPKRDFFIWSETGKEFPHALNPLSHIKPSNWIPNPKTGDYYFASFYPQQPDLNWENPQIFKEMMKIIDFWCERGADGFRLDAVPFLAKLEGTRCIHLPEVHTILKKIRKYMDKNHPGVVLLAEANGLPERVGEYFGKGDECHLAFNFLLMSKIFLAIKRGDLSIAQKVIESSFNIPDNCQWATFLRNHDELTLSHISTDEQEELLSWLDPENKYSFKGGHGTSVRLGTIFGGNKEKILEAFNLLFCMPGSPVIYYGDEIGMENLDLNPPPVDSRLYVRGDFDWAEAGKQIEDPHSLMNGIKSLISKDSNKEHAYVPNLQFASKK
jgi:maltose alpha-D-glucosyltransferase/alpha-amylase